MNFKLLSIIMILLIVSFFLRFRLEQKGGLYNNNVIVTHKIIRSTYLMGINFIIDGASLTSRLSNMWDDDLSLFVCDNLTYKFNQTKYYCSYLIMDSLRMMGTSLILPKSLRNTLNYSIEVYFSDNFNKSWFSPKEIYEYIIIKSSLNESINKTYLINLILRNFKKQDGGFGYHNSFSNEESTLYAIRSLKELDYSLVNDIHLKDYVNNLPNSIYKYEMQYLMNNKSDLSLGYSLGYFLLAFSPIPTSFSSLENVADYLLIMKYGGLHILIPIGILIFLAFAFWSL